MKSNKYLTIGLLTGFIVGGCIGVLAWAFLQNLFAISICAGTGISWNCAVEFYSDDLQPFYSGISDQTFPLQAHQ